MNHLSDKSVIRPRFRYYSHVAGYSLPFHKPVSWRLGKAVTQAFRAQAVSMMARSISGDMTT